MAGSPRQTRDFVHVEDAARAVVHFLDRPGTFNIGSGTGMGLQRLADLVCERFPAPVVHQAGPELGDFVADTARARRAGFEARWSVENYLRSA